jgi:hypothetical protein
MTPRQWAFSLSGLLICGLAAFGAAHLSLGLGMGANSATAFTVAVGVWANILVDARYREKK